ncbi:MAG: hypothetical protein HOB82_01380 [Alphaproteobacteria bacterium]|nr:hypothetical protein [Alphaproteobacteria bacterium]
MSATLWLVPTGVGAQSFDRDTPENSVSPGDYGGIGLLQMRNARFGPDGLFSIGYSRVEPYKRWGLSIHILPWLETTFRYTEVRNRLFSDNLSFSGLQAYKDRGADIKVRLLKESDYLPAVAIGLQDGLGTGLFAGEFLVASKRYRDLDFSLGLGWGYVGSRGGYKNPMRILSEDFGTRTGISVFGGTAPLESLFSGAEVGIFGGIEYRTPIRGLTLKVEYDSHDYAVEPLAAFSKPGVSPINIGFNFRPYPWFDMSFGIERGNTMIHFSLRSNFQAPGVAKIDVPPPEVGPRRQLAELISPELRAAPGDRGLAATDPATQVFQVMAENGLAVDQISLAGAEMILTVSSPNGTTNLAQRQDAAVRALALLPADIDKLTLVDAPAGAALLPITVRRGQIQGVTAVDALYERLSELGLEVEAFEIQDSTAIVTVAAINPSVAVNFAAAARIAGRTFGMSDAVIIDARTGQVEIWEALPIQPDTRVVAISQTPGNLVGGNTFRLPPLDPPYEPEDKEKVAVQLAERLEENTIFLEALEMSGRHATVYLTGLRFMQTARNLGYAARITSDNLPAPIEEITIVSLNGGMETSRFTFFRSDLERGAAHRGSPEEILEAGTLETGYPGRLGSDVTVPGRYPRVGWSVSPQTRQHIGGPDQFVLYQIWLAFRFNADLGRGFSFSSIFGRDLYNNFDKIKLQSDSVLPHVRSDIKEYLQQGTNNIVRLQLDYMYKPAKDIYARVSAGIFEEMFGGISGELLYRPFDSRLAISLEVNQLFQRKFDQRLEFKDYRVKSGHLTFYYDMPYNNLLATVSAGRFLAKDTGVTFDLSRVFDSGVRVGAWATFTNVPAIEFGEGSFDKGFYFVIPFELFFQEPSTSTGVFAFRPLFRDGGQRLVMANRLFEVTGNGTRDAVTRDWSSFLK